MFVSPVVVGSRSSPVALDGSCPELHLVDVVAEGCGIAFCAFDARSCIARPSESLNSFTTVNREPDFERSNHRNPRSSGVGQSRPPCQKH